MHPATRRWWTLLRAGSALNVVLWMATAALLPLDAWEVQAQLWLATIYVAVCGFRSFYPRVDLERTVLVDHPLSTIALGRTAATFAELAFTVQCAMFLGDLGTRAGLAWAVPHAWSMVPLIALAQTACWLGLITLNHLWHAVEEALWAVMMAMLAAVFAFSWPEVGESWHAVIALGLVGCACGAFVMVVLDIPMYVRRWRESKAEGVRFLGISEGIADAIARREPTGSWEVWRHEVAWMTPYFTVGVWISLAMVWIAAGVLG